MKNNDLDWDDDKRFLSRTICATKCYPPLLG